MFGGEKVWRIWRIASDAKLKPSKLFHLKLSPCIELYEFRFKALFVAAVANSAIAIWLIFKGLS